MLAELKMLRKTLVDPSITLAVVSSDYRGWRWVEC